MCPAHAGLLAASCEPFACVFTDRLEHPEALVRVPDEALVDQRLQRVEFGACDLLRRLERAAAAEDGQAGEELMLLRAQQIVAPLDRRAQRLLAHLGIAAALKQ